MSLINKVYTAQDMRDAAKCLFACEVDLKHDNRDISRMLRQSADMMDMAVGNAAAMREALSDSCYAMFNFLKTQNGGYVEMANALDKAKAALAKPPRNCDRFTTLDDARNAFFEDYVPDETCSSANAFAIWLFDEAKGATE